MPPRVHFPNISLGNSSANWHADRTHRSVCLSMSNTGPGLSILLVAGDVSGDVHAAALARTLLGRDADLTVHALGGKRLREVVRQSSGGEFLADTTNCSAIGFASVIPIYFHCRKLREGIWTFLRRQRVDLAILCDWGGFNGRVLPGLHARGIP